MKTVRTSVVCERGDHFVSGGNVLLRFIAVSATIPNIRDVCVIKIKFIFAPSSILKLYCILNDCLVQIASWLSSEVHPAITHW